MRDGLDQSFSRQRHILTSVCRNWRSIAITTPSLWSSLFININQAKLARDVDTIISNINRNFERSGDVSLVIRLHIHRYHWISLNTTASILNLLDNICKQAHRWKTLAIKAPPDILTFISQYTSELSRGTPRLSSLMLFNDPSGEDEAILNVSIGQPTNPTSLVASPTYIWTRNIVLTTKTVDFSQLTDLEYRFPTVSELVEVLAVSPCLRSLICGIASHKSRKSYLTSPISTQNQIAQALNCEFVHSSMKSWVVRFDYNGLLPRFTFPSLEHLDYVHRGTSGLRAIYDFLTRSHCPLTTLCIGIACEEDEFIDLLRLTPDLRELTISENSISSQFFQHLGETAIQSSKRSTFLPHLQKFHFQATQISSCPFNWSYLRTMSPGETRQPIFRPLTKVVIGMHAVQVGKMELMLQSDLVGVIDDGLEVVAYHRDADLKVNVLEFFEPLKQALERLHGTQL